MAMAQMAAPPWIAALPVWRLELHGDPVEHWCPSCLPNKNNKRTLGTHSKPYTSLHIPTHPYTSLHSKSLKPQIVCCNFGHAFSKVPRIGVGLRKMFLALLSSNVWMDFEHLRMKPKENPINIWSSSPDFGLSGSSSGTCVGVATLRLHVYFHTEGEGNVSLVLHSI